MCIEVEARVPRPCCFEDVKVFSDDPFLWLSFVRTTSYREGFTMMCVRRKKNLSLVNLRTKTFDVLGNY